MYFEEKLDILKKRFSITELRIPFNDANSILKKIERKFIFQKKVIDDFNSLGNYFNNWSSNIKEQILMSSFAVGGVYKWLEKLGKESNYWVVLAFSDESKHYIFDCKPKAIISLLYISNCDFYIIEKKYKWFTYFNIDKTNRQINLYKSGDFVTDFEN